MKTILISVVRALVGLGLLPVCLAAVLALRQILLWLHDGTGGRMTPEAWWMSGGFLLWVAMFVLLPRPVRSYVLAHELTHALWAKLFRARVLGIRVRKDSGSVMLSRSNFLIALAPYFFPLYTVLVIIVWSVVSLRVDLGPYTLYILGLIGFTWGFHFTFTLHTLLQEQSDIRACGALFSYTFIFLMNVLGIMLFVAVVSSITVVDAGRIAVDQGRLVCGWLMTAARAVARQ